jgi:hypothetical protein
VVNRVIGVLLASLGLAAPCWAQSQATASPWSVIVAPYAWGTFISGTQTVAGQTLTVDTNPVQMFADSQSLLTLMLYGEARYEDRIGFFVDVVYADLTAGQSATKNISLQGIVSANATASATARYQTLTTQFGMAYELGRYSGTAVDAIVGGRYWHQSLDLTLYFSGNVSVNYAGLSATASTNQVKASSGSIDWVDPLVGFRLRHALAPGQELLFEADVGGFGIGSQISAQGQVAYAFNLGKAMDVAWSGVLGYRALYVDYTRGSGSSYFALNQLQQGPLLGISGRF